MCELQLYVFWNVAVVVAFDSAQVQRSLCHYHSLIAVWLQVCILSHLVMTVHAC